MFKALLIAASVVVGLLLILALVARMTIRVLTGAPCEDEGSACQGSMRVKRVPYGTQQVPTDCLVCDTCGRVIPLDPAAAA